MFFVYLQHNAYEIIKYVQVYIIHLTF